MINVNERFRSMPLLRWSLIISTTVLTQASVEMPLSAIRVDQARYYPVQWATIDALTTKEIEEAFDITSCLQKRGLEIRKVLARKSGAGLFDGAYVRLKIVYSDGVTVYMDRAGGVRWGDNSYALSKEDLAVLFDELHMCLPPPPRTKSSPP